MTSYEKKDTLLKVSNVSKSYGSKCVLRDINFEIKDIIRPDQVQGQVISLLGASGVGKSTLFGLLAGLDKPTGGQILAGVPLKPVQAGDMGVVYQNYYLYTWEKVRHILEMAMAKNPLLYCPKNKVENRVMALDAIVKDFNLLDHLDKYPSQLSGGQKQRVALAEQILCGNEFILLDEPFSGLDVLTIDKVINFLIKVSLADELKTLIIVSHDLSNTCAISDTVFILAKEEGKEGATIVKEINMIDRDLAWRANVKDDPNFRETLKEIKSLL